MESNDYCLVVECLKIRKQQNWNTSRSFLPDRTANCRVSPDEWRLEESTIEFAPELVQVLVVCHCEVS